MATNETQIETLLVGREETDQEMNREGAKLFGGFGLGSLVVLSGADAIGMTKPDAFHRGFNGLFVATLLGIGFYCHRKSLVETPALETPEPVAVQESPLEIEPTVVVELVPEPAEPVYGPLILVVDNTREQPAA